MKKSITFRTKYGWISAFEEKGKITEIKFLKTKNKNIGTSRILQRLRGKIKSYFSNLQIFCYSLIYLFDRLLYT